MVICSMEIATAYFVLIRLMIYFWMWPKIQCDTCGYVLISHGFALLMRECRFECVWLSVLADYTNYGVYYYWFGSHLQLNKWK